jgi:hypothetical protein
MSLHSVFNYAEAAFWWTFALVFLIRAIRAEQKWKRDQFILALAFAGFGLSDWIEVGTGAWWRPWWLLALKGVCLLTIVYSLWKLWPLLKPKPQQSDDQK